MRTRTRSSDLVFRGLRLALALVLACAAAPEPAHAEDRGAAGADTTEKEPDDPRRKLEELGDTLKAAVLSGRLTEEEAGEIYKAALARLEAEAKTSTDKDGEKARAKRDDDADERADPKSSVRRLAPPKPGQIRALFGREFVMRDLIILRDELGLDAEQMAIAEVLLTEYLDAMDLATTPLREALGRYHETSTDRRIVAALERSDRTLATAAASVPSSEAGTGVATMKARLEKMRARYGKRLEAASQEDRAKFEAWTQRMIESSRQLDERLAALRERVNADLAEVERSDATIAAEDLVRMAKELRAERARLRASMIDSLAAVATEAQRGEDDSNLAAALARIRIAHLLPRGRLGGESMNLWAALIETRHDLERQGEQTGRLELVDSMLRRRTPAIAETLKRRLEAALDREIEGLGVLVERDRIAAAKEDTVDAGDAHRLTEAHRPYAAAARREAAAAVTVRDALRALLKESAASIDERSPDSGLSEVYRETSLRRGFPVEMRRRWSERALTDALRLDDLDDETREALHALESEIASDLAALRADAIAKRIKRDPKLARAFIDAAYGDGKQDVKWELDMWLGINHEAFAAIDDRTEHRLRAILTPDQIERLPALRRAEAATTKQQARGKGSR